MSVEIASVSDALKAVVIPKLQEIGLATDADAEGLAEYVMLMLGNGKSEDEIAREVAVDLLGLAPDDANLRNFTKWLFEQANALSAQLNGGDNNATQHGGSLEMDTDMNPNDASELNAPTGPRSMRNGNGNMRGNRDKRMDGGGIHRVRGNDRINTNNRMNGPNGQRGGMRGGRNNNNNGIRASNLQAGLNGGQWMMQPGMQPGMQQGGQPNQMELMAMLEQQNQMMFQLSQQLMNGPAQRGGRGGGKSLFERTQDPNRRNFRRGQNNNTNNHNQQPAGTDGTAETAETTEGGGDDVDMGGGNREAANTDDSICKYNLRCTNSECKFAHQSPAAPPGTHVDVKDICSFGAACKNRKCVGRHPSPATRLAHQGEQDCKFFPNCHNPRCPFRHPSMPLCRNGADCTTENCKFTHVKTKCRFNPCLNPTCAFAHEEGQQGGFKDKVWTAEGGEHVSDRKFVEDDQGEELIKPDDEMRQQQEAAIAQETDVIG